MPLARHYRDTLVNEDICAGYETEVPGRYRMSGQPLTYQARRLERSARDTGTDHVTTSAVCCVVPAAFRPHRGRQHRREVDRVLNLILILAAITGLRLLPRPDDCS